MKPVRLSAHALSYTTKRGFTIDEVEKAIQDSLWEPLESGRLQCRKNFPFGHEWNGKVYETKQIRPIFVEQADEIILIIFKGVLT